MRRREAISAENMDEYLIVNFYKNRNYKNVKIKIKKLLINTIQKKIIL